MLGEKMGYSGDLFSSVSFFEELFEPFMGLCKEPSCDAKCVNCNKGCNKGPDPDPSGT